MMLTGLAHPLLEQDGSTKWVGDSNYRRTLKSLGRKQRHPESCPFVSHGYLKEPTSYFTYRHVWMVTCYPYIWNDPEFRYSFCNQNIPLFFVLMNMAIKMMQKCSFRLAQPSTQTKGPGFFFNYRFQQICLVRNEQILNVCFDLIFCLFHVSKWFTYDRIKSL